MRKTAHKSSNNTLEQHVKFSPTAPHLSETRMTVQRGSLRILSSASSFFLAFILPSTASTMEGEKSGQGRRRREREKGEQGASRRLARGAEGYKEEQRTASVAVALLLQERLEDLKHGGELGKGREKANRISDAVIR